MHELSAEGRRIVEDLASRHSVSPEAVAVLLQALAAGGGSQAQFNHPELGGLGQWSAGGMLMIGDMFNNVLKHRVDQLASELAGHLRTGELFAADEAPEPRDGREGIGLFAPGSGGIQPGGWPSSLGAPASTGSQNDLHYAYFPDSRRLAVRKGGHVTLYDTGEHIIGGVSQQQGGGQSLAFTSQLGRVRVEDLPVVPAAEPKRTGERADAPRHGDILATIERLAELRDKGVLTEAEFSVKKAELLRRL